MTHPIEVLRFWNNDVLQQTAGVLAAIWQEMSLKIPLSPTLSPRTQLFLNEHSARGEGASSCLT